MTPNPADERTGAAPAPGAAPTPPPPSPSPAVAWREIGRGEHGNALWVTWIGFADGRGRGGSALYRSLVVADDTIEVAVEREPPSGTGVPRPVHRGWCGPPPPDDARGVDERAAPLLAAADEAVGRTDGGGARPDTGARPDLG